MKYMSMSCVLMIIILLFLTQCRFSYMSMHRFNHSHPYYQWVMLYLSLHCLYYQGNVEHCGASVSKQSTVALKCYVVKALPVKSQITAHRPCMAYIAKTRFVTLLSTKIAQIKLSCSQRRACHGVVTHNGAISSTTKQLLWLLHTQDKPEHSQACTVL